MLESVSRALAAAILAGVVMSTVWPAMAREATSQADETRFLLHSSSEKPDLRIAGIARSGPAPTETVTPSSSARTHSVARPAAKRPRFRVLVFSKTAGYRHASIPDGIEAIRKLGLEHDFAVDATEDAAVFTRERLEAYDAVIFLSTSGDALNEEQQAAFERYIRRGGGYAGIHGAAATEYDWHWYGRLVGAFFDDHPTPQPAEIQVLDRVHPSTRHLPPVWRRFDEWYNFRTDPSDSVHVLAVLDEETYEGGTMGHNHPIAWARRFDGGRSWYTALGHTSESFTEPAYLQHLLGGIEWTAGVVQGDVGATQSSHFEKVVLTTELTDPMEMGIAPDGRVFVAERFGPIKMWDPETGRTQMVGFVPVRMTIEDGLLGLTLDPDFADNGWLYVYYAPADGGPSRLSRVTFDGERIDLASENILLEIDTQQQECCHSAGSLTFGPEGNLYLSTGDNTDPYPLGGSPIDERPGRKVGDAQRTSANTNDLRGKILRIRPLPDGSYAIPEGNLFEGDSLHRPEIYTMGHRNPYRISVDPETGWLYWGDVGIGNAPSEERGPWGWEEVNQARGPGFYGWPYFVGPNDAYRDYDYETEEAGPYFNPKAPVNESPNNTGARMLPPSSPAMIWYAYGPSEEFPALGAGGMSAMAGPVYRHRPETTSPHALPAYYDGTLFIYEWMRNWIKLVKFDDAGRLMHIAPFLPDVDFVRPTDMEVGADGRLYVLEWGETFWGSNEDAQLVRLDYEEPTPSAPSGETSSSSEAEKNPRASSDLPRNDSDPTGKNPSVSFDWPPGGGIFDYGVPIRYEVRRADSGESELDPNGVVVRTYTGHDTHKHPLDTLRGARGEAVIGRAFTHVPDIHYVDRFAVLEAAVGSDALDAVTDRVVLRPRVLEAEHAAESRGAERQTFGKHPAEPDFAEAAFTVMTIERGGYLAYSPLNLTGIDSLAVRFKPVPGGTIELRQDGLDGRVLARAAVDSSSGSPVNVLGTKDPAHGLEDVPEETLNAYRGWREIRVPLAGASGGRSLYLRVDADAEGIVIQLDRLRFVGPGIARR